MNWFQRMFFKASERVVRFMPEWVRATFLPISWARLIDGYHKNSAVGACVTTLAFSFPEAPLLAGYEQDGRFVADYGHPIMALIRQPNPDMGEVELMQFAVTYASIGGNLYLWKQRGQGGQVIALWPFSDAQIDPVPGSSTAEGFVKEYDLDVGDGKGVTIKKDDMIQWKWGIDPAQPARGIGALQIAIRDADRDSEANSYIYALLKNNAVPPVVVTLTEGDELTEDKAKRLRAEWNQKYGGDAQGNVAFLEAGMKAEKLGFDLQQLAAEALNAVPEARIAASFRVPPVVAGLSVGLKRSDYGDVAARRSFTELTLAALWRSLASELYNGLKDEFPTKPGFALKFDLRQVRALQEEESKLWERVTGAFNRSLLTRAEAKRELGLEPKPEDEVYLVSLATEFIPAAPPAAKAGSPQMTGTQFRGRAIDAKARAAVAAGLRNIRAKLVKKMSAQLDKYFADLADAVVARAEASKALAALAVKGNGHKDDTPLPSADDLLNNEDGAKLIGLVKRFYASIIETSWDTWNTALGVAIAFDLADPLVTQVLGKAATRVLDINQTTLEALRSALEQASEAGWGVDQLVRGDPANGIPGLRDIVEETYKGRAETIARTELGEAQNAATAGRYKAAGVDRVEILDNGNEATDDADCIDANGQIWTLSYFEANPLQHPNCTRAAAPYFGDAEAVH